MRVLETQRMNLRWFEVADADFVLELVNDRDWIANIGDRGVRTLEDARRFISDRLVAAYRSKGFGLWAMERREDGTLLGMCGFVERDFLPEIDVGYALAPAYRRLGYAKEAVSAALRYGRDVLGRPRILAIVSPGNDASIRVLAGVGMAPEGTVRNQAESRDALLFSWSGGDCG